MKSSRSPGIVELLPELQDSVDLLSIHLTRSRSEEGTHCVAFAGTESGAGSTVLAAATALKMALYDREPVLLVETDIRKPCLAAYFRLPLTPGYSEILKGEATVEECLRSIPDVPTLRVITGGLARELDPGELAMENGRTALDWICKQDGLVLLDTAPILEVPETKTLIRRATGVVLISRARATRKAVAKKAVVAYKLLGTPVLGVVLNQYRPERILGF